MKGTLIHWGFPLQQEKAVNWRHKNAIDSAGRPRAREVTIDFDSVYYV